MEINSLQENEFRDIFSPEGVIEDQVSKSARFTIDNEDTAIFNAPPKTDIEEKEKEEDRPIFEEKQVETKETSPFSIESYFEERVKNGLFVPIEDEDDQGQVKNFVPKTAEDLDEIINLQINYKLQEKVKGLEESWYTSKSPAWQAVAKFAEMTDDPGEIIPFISGVKQIEEVSTLDPSDIGQAEQIIRMRMRMRGDAEDIIDEQVEALKTTDKLVSTAQKYKPVLIQEEQQRLVKLKEQKEQETAQYYSLVTNIRENAIKAIDAPLFGNKLKREEQAAIYDLIGEPDYESKGYRIYSAIDKLFETGNFEKLKKVALLLSDEDSLVKYASSKTALKTAGDLQKKLRVSVQSKVSNEQDFSDKENIISRKKYEGKFGR